VIPPRQLLNDGNVVVEGRMPWSSNGTFLVTVSQGDDTLQAVYKPVRGERPLWDFPPGLYRREMAAYVLSEAMGLGVVPITVVREGPFGLGSLQAFVAADFEQHYFTIHEQREDLHDTLRAICAFDVIANNTDRKSGHVLLGVDGRLWAIDNGLCFATDFKLRTVIWEFAGEPLDDALSHAVACIADRPPDALASWLDAEELDAVARRATALADRGRFPVDPTGRRYPWPLV